jgi:hypothetical protein
MSMASFVDMDENIGVVDKRRGRGTNTSQLATPGNYVSVGTLETRLLAIGYTQARINQMTWNDMVYAVRINDDAAGIK